MSSSSSSSATPSPPSTCPVCGGPLNPSLLGGGCGACLWSDLLLGEEEEMAAMGDLPVVPGYDILEEIGHGGMGVVFRAKQESSGREVALKMVAPQSLRALEARQRFLMEVEAMAAVEHPAMVPLYDSGEDRHGRPWLAMQLLMGGSLLDQLSVYGKDWRKSAELMVVLAKAVAFAHSRGVLHRDLKPANILFDEAGHPYVADFGLAKWADEEASISRSGHLLGSPAYLAPEAAIGGSKATTTVSDVYGLGAIFYELLCGDRPYQGASGAEILTQIRERAPVPPRKKLKDIPADLEVIVMKAMAREPEGRYASAAALADDMERWLAGMPILARPVGPVGRLRLWAKRNPALAALSALLALCLVTSGVLLWRANQRLQASLDDVEARVDFMTRELPMALAPVGRLDLLDGVFANVSEHFDKYPARDAGDLARKAEFLTEWSQTLRPRGQIKEAVARLEQAVAAAKAASAGSGPFPPEVLRARLVAGWRLGEALIIDKQLVPARAILDETRAFAQAHLSNDLRFQMLRAQLVLEPAYAAVSQGQTNEALVSINDSLKLWDDLQPQVEREIKSPHVQAACVDRVKASILLSNAERGRGQMPQAIAALDQALAFTQRLLDLVPGQFVFIDQRANLLYMKGEALSDDLGQRKTLYEEADRLCQTLLTQDAANVGWRTLAVTVSKALSRHAYHAGDAAEERRWAEVTAERIAPLYLVHTTDLKYIRARDNLAMFCGNFFNDRKEYAKVFVHYDAVVRAKKLISQAEPDGQTNWEPGKRIKEYEKARTAAYEWLKKDKSVEAADAWLREIEAYGR